MISKYTYGGKIISIFLLITCSLTVYLSQNKLLAATVIPVPSSAYDIEKLNLKEESAVQLEFKVKTSYPNVEVMDYYFDYYANKGWDNCGTSKTWSEYLKKINSINKNLPIRQRMQYMANKKEKKLFMVALRYFGEPASTESKAISWNNHIQHVIVILYSLDDDSFDKTLSFLKLKCSN